MRRLAASVAGTIFLILISAVACAIEADCMRAANRASYSSFQSPETERQPETTRIAVGFGPQGIAFTPGAVWVAYGNNREYGVARIDFETNRVLARVETGRWPVGAAAGEGSIWIANRNDNSVTRVSPESNRAIATIAVGKKPLGIEAGEGSVWTANTGSKSVSRIDPKTNTSHN